MGRLFYLRGDSLTPRYAMGGKEYTLFLEGGSLGAPPAPEACADASCFGGFAINVNQTGNYKQVLYPARKNWVRNQKVFSIRARIAPAFTGTPPADMSPVRVGQLNQATVYGGVRWVFQDNNLLLSQAMPKQALAHLFLDATPTLALTNGVFKDYMLTSDGTNWYASIDGVQVATGSVSNAGDANYDLDWLSAAYIILGQYPWKGWINDLSIWDTCEAHVYTARTGWDSVADFDGTSNSDPGEGNVRNGTAYTIAGVSKTGTVVVPSLANTKTGVAGDGGTGTYDGSDRWTDPGESNVSAGVQYKANSTSLNKTGTRQSVTNVHVQTALRGQQRAGILRQR